MSSHLTFQIHGTNLSSYCVLITSAVQRGSNHIRILKSDEQINQGDQYNKQNAKKQIKKKDINKYAQL